MRNKEAEAAYLRRNERVGEFLGGLEHGRGVKGLEEGEITRVTILVPSRERPEALIAVKATTAAGKWVGFVGALTVSDAILMWRVRDERIGLKWREDIPWEQRG